MISGRPPTAYAGWAAAVSLSLVGLGVFFGNVPALSLGAVLLLGLALGLALGTPSGIVVSRDIARASASIGESLQVEWVVTVPSGFGPVTVFDRLPDDLALVSGSNTRVFWKWIGPRTFTNRYSFECAKRGVYRLRPTEWESRHALDLRPAARGATEAVQTLTVFPKVLPVRRLRGHGGIASSRPPAGALATLGVATTDFKEIRAYHAGDPIRSINWKASARYAAANAGRPLVNEFQREGRRAVWLFVDCSDHMVVGTNLVNPLESAIEAANAMGHFFLNRGYYLGAHFSASPDELLYADIGKRHFYALSSRLSKLVPGGTHYDLVRAAHFARQHLLSLAPVCIVITRLDAPGSEPGDAPRMHPRMLQGIDLLGHMSPSRVRRMPVWVVGINGYFYSSDFLSGPAFAANIRHLETRAVVDEVRRRSATLLEWDPKQESFATALLRFTRLVKVT